MASKQQERYIRYYTEGTAARQMEVRQPGRTHNPPRQKKKVKVRVITVDPVAICGIVLSVVMLVMMLGAVSDLREAKLRRQEMVDYLYALESENWKNSKQYYEDLNLEEVEERALKLGLVPIENVKHVTIEVPAAQEEAAQEELNWWERLCTYLEGLIA